MICINDNTSENLKNEVFKMMGGSVVAADRRYPTEGTACGKRCSPVDWRAAPGTSESIAKSEWPIVSYVKRKGKRRVSRFSVEADLCTKMKVDEMLTGYEFCLDVSNMEGNKRWNAMNRYLCFCSGDLHKAQSPKSVRAYIMKLHELSDPAMPWSLSSEFERLSPKTLANEISALKGAIQCIQSSQEDEVGEGWQHWTATLLAVKGGLGKCWRAAAKQQSIHRTNEFERLPCLEDAIKKVDKIVTVEFIKYHLGEKTRKGWNKVIGGVICHLYARTNFARPQGMCMTFISSFI